MQAWDGNATTLIRKNKTSIVDIQQINNRFTRACFAEQKTAYWILVDIVVVAIADVEDAIPLPGRTVDELISGDVVKPSVCRFVLPSELQSMLTLISIENKNEITFRIPFFARW